MTLAHLSVSSPMSLAYSPGESASTSPPSSAMRALIVGSARAALISRLSRSMISAGVFFGAPKPAHALEVVIEIVVERGVDHVVGADGEQRVAIGWRARHDLGCDIATGARAVLDDELLT